MKKFILFALISCIFISVVVAADEVLPTNPTANKPPYNYTYIEKQGAMTGDFFGFLDVSVALDTLSVADIGFANSALTNIKDPVTAVLDVQLSKLVNDKFESQKDVYVYYRIVASPQNYPIVNLSIDSPLVSLDPDKTGAVDWGATCYMDPENPEDKGSKITSIKDADNKQTLKIFPLEDTSKLPQVLTTAYNSFKVTFSTEEPYWNDPMAAYGGYLWVKVQGV